MNKKKVAVLVGSLRAQSISRMLARALMECAPEALEFEPVEIGALPLYNADLETEEAPAPWKEFRAAIRRADALLFVTPEYNRSIPGALKNAIDVGSRPPGKSVWAGKPAAIMSQSQGPLGGAMANHHLRQAFVPIDIRVMQAPEGYISQSATLFDQGGKLTRDDTREFLKKFMAAFAQWIDRLEVTPR